MQVGLKTHTHRDRLEIIEALTPLIQKHAGSNLLALAVSGSFARGNDGAYSDLEFFGFLRRPVSADREAVRFIHDGLLVDIWFMTRNQYISIYKRHVRVGDNSWPYVAKNALSPILNSPFIKDLEDIPHTINPDAFRRALEAFWPQVQEATAKLLTAVERNDALPVPYLYWQVVERICCALSYLNEQPYSTRAAVFDEALSFPILPESFANLLLTPDEPRDPSMLAERAKAAFHELEIMLQKRDYKLYADCLTAFVAPQSRAQEWARRFKLDRAANKALRIGKKIALPCLSG